jgi:sterol desaturase/sphingolipid hydroxylase (fatty acid hydroxylase superfamily)
MFRHRQGGQKMPLDGKMFWFAIPIFIGFVAVEMLMLRYFGRSGYSWRESLATIGVGVGHKLSGLVRFGALGAASAWLWNYRLAEVPLDTVWGLSLLFVAVEFTYYWYHRFSHTVRWMWASHAVHHSPEELNVLASFRLSWTSMLSGDFLLFLPLIWIGFQPAAVVTALALNLIYQSWVHTELIPKLGFVDGVLNTPSNHRVHHASNEVYLDRNYGGVLIIFDRIFGSYVAEREDVPCRYGLVKPVGSANPIWIAFHEWIAMMRDVASSRTLGEAFGYLFGRPDWRPDVRAETRKVRG